MMVAHVTQRQWLDSLILVDIHQGRLPPRQGPPHHEVDGELWVRGGGQVKISKSNTALTASTTLCTQRAPASYRNPS